MTARRTSAGRAPRTLALGLVTAAALGVPACRQDMHDNPRYEALEASEFFPDLRASRPLVEGTVAQGQALTDPHRQLGMVDGEPAARSPLPTTPALLARGRERFDIFCSPCHGRVGDGRGMVVQRGVTAPPTYHQPRLRDAPDGHLFQVITDGLGAMYGLAHRVPVDDRWAIVAYVRALQLSQHAPVDALDKDDLRRLDGAASEQATAPGDRAQPPAGGEEHRP